MFLSINAGLILGVITLTVARLSALIEKDGKKIVALSTLSQLGLIFIAIRLSNYSICIFHIITHAVAKANLFIIVGNLLHKLYSEQDRRFIFIRNSYLVLLISIVRVFRLLGLVFTSGFYSKETILLRTRTLLSRVLIFIILIAIIRLTLTYCIKIIVRIENKSKVFNMEEVHYRFIERRPPTIIRIIRLLLGLMFMLNTVPQYFFVKSNNNLYWMILVLGLSRILIREKVRSFLIKSFYTLRKIIDKINFSTILVKVTTKTIETQIETTLNLFSINLISLQKTPGRITTILPSILLGLILI